MRPFRFSSRSAVALAVALAAAASQAGATTVWNEDVDSDLSDDRLNPTRLSLVAGANELIGSIGLGDPDYFSFVVPAGFTLTAIHVLPGTAVSGSASFVAIELGDKITTTPTGGNVGDLLAYSHYGNDAVGTNLLGTVLYLPGGASSLPSGTYSMWLNETGGTVPYRFDFVLASSVPEPSGALALSAGLLALRLRRKR